MINLKEEKSSSLANNRLFFYIFLFIKNIFSLTVLIVLFISISQSINYFFFKRNSFSNKFEENLLDESGDKNKKEDNSFYNDNEWINLINNSNARNEIKKKIGSVSLLDNYRIKLSKNIFNQKGMIFYGPPGTGKSHCAELIAKNISSSYKIVAAGSFQEIYVGSGSKKWNELIESCKKKLKNFPKDESRPIVIIVEEIDSLISKGKHDRGKDDTLVNNFLGSFDEIKRDNLNILIIGTTNYIHCVEEAAIREGRLSAIEFGFPKEESDFDCLLKSVKSKIENEYYLEYSLKDFRKFNKDVKKIFIKEEYWIELKKRIVDLCNNDPYLNLIFPWVFSAVENTFLHKINSKSENLNVLINGADSTYTIKDISDSNSSRKKNSKVDFDLEKGFSELIEKLRNS